MIKKKQKDPFVKIYMLYRGQRVEKKQTKIVEKSRNPKFDESFEFNLLSIIQQSHTVFLFFHLKLCVLSLFRLTLHS